MGVVGGREGGSDIIIFNQNLFLKRLYEKLFSVVSYQGIVNEIYIEIFFRISQDGYNQEGLIISIGEEVEIWNLYVWLVGMFSGTVILVRVFRMLIIELVYFIFGIDRKEVRVEI